MPLHHTVTLPIERYHRMGTEGSIEAFHDQLAVEEPLEIRIGSGESSHRSLSITMRTPGHDEELALGFLCTEGLLESYSQVERAFSCGSTGNVLRVQLREGTAFDWEGLSRNFYMTSSCGVCGKSSIEALAKAARHTHLAPLRVERDVICELPRKLREAQKVFSETGGLHAAALFSAHGDFLDLREDVGRHNALDKLIGSSLKNARLPLDQAILVLSGRASFELIQKAYMAGVQLVVAMGAPSSLAAQLAAEKSITLIGFAKADRFNVYSGFERIGEPV